MTDTTNILGENMLPLAEIAKPRDVVMVFSGS